MNQYAIAHKSSQADRELSEQVAQQLQRFVQPLLEVLDAYVDCRLVATFQQTLVAIIVARTSLLLSVLGEYLADPQHGPAGTKQLSRLLHSAKWCSGLIERFLWQQAERGLSELEAAGEQPLCIWDGSVLEKPESEHLEGLAPVRSSKAKRLQRSRPGVFNKPGRPIVVRGWEWTAVLLGGLKGAVQVVSMRWWSRKGEQATTARDQEGHLLRECARRWGRRVLHLFDRGYAGGPWLGELGRAGVRFVIRWPKRYQLLDAKGVERKAWQIAMGKRAWGTPRWVWDSQLRKLRQTSVVALPVRHASYVGPLWLVIARRGGEPWYLLTNEPIESEEAAWQVVLAYARRWQVETSFRYGKSELRMESPRLQQWEPRRKLLLLVTLVYAFLLSLLAHEHDLLRQCVLDRWSHRTGRRARKTRTPLYRLRWALSRLWQHAPPPTFSRSSQPVSLGWSGRLTAWLMWFLVFLNLCPKSSG
jgi:Transposase DDE domain